MNYNISGTLVHGHDDNHHDQHDHCDQYDHRDCALLGEDQVRLVAIESHKDSDKQQGVKTTAESGNLGRPSI